MLAVLYTEDLVPITVIDVPLQSWQRLWKGEPWQLVPLLPPRLPGDDLENMTIQLVTVLGEPLKLGDVETRILVTRDSEAALLLESSLLPGQLK